MNKEFFQIDRETFLRELQAEYEYHTNGKSTYRQQTAKMAIFVAENVEDPIVFSKRETALQIAAVLLNENSDEDRLSDVGKCLYTIYCYLYRQHIWSGNTDMREYVEKKKQKKKPLGFLPK